MPDALPPIMPPKRLPARPRPFDVFVELFEPIDRDGYGRIIWQAQDIPEDADPREWWTIVDGDTGDRTFLMPGFRRVNRLGYIRCAARWGGEASDHPIYRFF